MIEVLFFAKLREELGVSHLSVESTANTASVASLQQYLIDQHDEAWAAVLSNDNIIRAVNQQVVELDHPIVDGSEVAFFPPVTGG